MIGAINFNLNNTQETVYQKEVKEMKGVDYSRNQVAIDENHASDMKNCILRNGILAKRNSLKEIKQDEFIPLDYYSSYGGLWGGNYDSLGDILSIHKIKVASGYKYIGQCKYNDTTYLYVSSDTIDKFYDDDDNNNPRLVLGYYIDATEPIPHNRLKPRDLGSKKVTFNMKDESTYYVFAENGIFKIMGNEENDDIAVVNLEGKKSIGTNISLELPQETYIPTTTTMITSTTSESEIERTSFEAINLLTSWHANKIITENKFLKYSGAVQTLMVTKGKLLDNYSVQDYSVLSTTITSNGDLAEHTGYVKYTGDSFFWTTSLGISFEMQPNKYYYIYQSYAAGVGNYYYAREITNAEKYYFDDVTIANVYQTGINNVIDSEGFYVRPNPNNFYEYKLDGKVANKTRYENVTIGNMGYPILFGGPTIIVKTLINGEVTSESQTLRWIEDYYISENEEGTTTIKISSSFIPTDEAIPNIIVYFYDDGITENLMYGCNISALYGNNNARNTLFVTGNDKHKNYDYHTDSDNWDYIPADSYSYFGSANNEIEGYLTLNDGTQAVLTKEGIFYRTCEMVEATNSMGETLTNTSGNYIYKEGYKITIGNIGEQALKGLTCNCNGDSLFLGKNGLFGVESRASTTTLERYAKIKSFYVNKALTKENLENANIIAYDNKVFIAVNKKVYVADTMYKSQVEFLNSDDIQYEWFIWDNLPITCFSIIDNELYCGLPNGRFAKFSEARNYDTLYRDLGTQYEGRTVIDRVNSQWVLNSLYSDDLTNLSDEDTIEFVGSAYYRIFEGELFVGNDIVIPKTFFNGNVDLTTQILIALRGMEFTTSTSNEATTFSMDFSYNEDLDFVLHFSEDLPQAPGGTGLGMYNPPKVYFKIKEPCKITNVQAQYLEVYEGGSSSGTVYLREVYFKDGYAYKDGNLLRNSSNQPMTKKDFNRFLIEYRLPSIDFAFFITERDDEKMYLCHNDLIESYYITKTYDLGSIQYLKNIKRLIMMPATSNNVSVKFGYQTLRHDKMYDLLTKDYSLYTGEIQDFSEFDFSSVSFGDREFNRTWSKRTCANGVNLIRFIFRNDDDKDFQAMNLTILYTLGKANKGVK